MIDFIRELFEFRFLSHAAVACLLAGVACGIMGTYIVCRRLVFLSGGITHASFGGIGIAYYLGLNPIAGAGVFAVASALSMELLSQKMKIREDSAIGILWSVGMAVGTVMVTLTPGYAPNLMSFLFGNILTITVADLWAMGVLAGVLLLVFALFYRPILYIAFDREYARTQGLPVGWVNGAMMALTAVTIVLSIRLVGIVLLISLLTLPPVIVNSVTRSYRKITVWSCLLSAAGTFTGLFVSYKMDIPSGAATIIVLSLTLILVKTIVYFGKKR
ncbi:MAG: metal ABC transporter permease [Rikenellaceae bacterium]|jgi:zinc transport system permease protein|nr:metal ABC transporter permease [Rikenellaceae bacterium]